MFQDYLYPQSTQEAVSMLNRYNGTARIIAGGTDLLLDIPNGKVQTQCLIDISKLKELKTLEITDGLIKIGAAVTHNQVAKAKLIQENTWALAQAALAVGSLQIRNAGTVIGNVVRAQPAADTAVALVALGAKVNVVSASQERLIPVEEMYKGVGESIVDSTRELATSVSVPICQVNQGSAFERLAKRRALALPMLNVAVVVSLKNDRFEWLRIAMAPVGIGPVRATKVEEFLQGKTIDSLNILEASKLAIVEANPRNSALRGSKEYRIQVLPILVKRAIENAVINAKYSK